MTAFLRSSSGTRARSFAASWSDAVLRGEKTATAGLLEDYEAEGEEVDAPEPAVRFSVTTTSPSLSSR